MVESPPELKRGDTKLSLQDGVYTNMYVPTLKEDPQPRWMPDHPDNLWHVNLGQEVKIVQILESNGVIQYAVRIVNSADTTQHIAVESQLRTLEEADRLPEGEAVPINKAPWTPIKNAMLEFLTSYPLPDADTRKRYEAQIKSKNSGLAAAIVDERQSEAGSFSGEANFADRMSKRSPGFPWEAIASLWDYSLPAR